MTRNREPLTSHPDDLRMLRSFGAEDATPDAAARAAARVTLLERIDAAAPAPALRSEAPLARRPRRRLLAGLGLASGVAAGVALALALGSGGVRPDAASAADALHAAAAVAADGSEVVLADGRYWYVETETYADARTFSLHAANGPVEFTLVDVRTRTELWVDAAGTGRMAAQMVSEPRFATPADREAWIAAGQPDLGALHDGGFAAGVVVGPDGTRQRAGWAALAGFSLEQLRALPTDEEALAARLATVAGDGPENVVVAAAGLLRMAPLAPEQRAALYRVLASSPGAQLLGTVTDERGRSGTGVAFERDGTRVELIFDPVDARLLDVTSDATDPAPAGLPAPARTQESLLASGVVDSSDARP